MSNIIPFLKGGIKKCFRPVSLLPLPSKIIEKIAHSLISNYFETNNYLDEKQGGFRKKRSTINTIAKLTDNIFKGIHDKLLTLACFIDIAKASDTVNHDILIKKLAKLGIGKLLLTWVRNDLVNRKQCTTANNVT